MVGDTKTGCVLKDPMIIQDETNFIWFLRTDTFNAGGELLTNLSTQGEGTFPTMFQGSRGGGRW